MTERSINPFFILPQRKFLREQPRHTFESVDDPRFSHLQRKDDQDGPLDILIQEEDVVEVASIQITIEDLNDNLSDEREELPSSSRILTTESEEGKFPAELPDTPVKKS